MSLLLLPDEILDAIFSFVHDKTCEPTREPFLLDSRKPPSKLTREPVVSQEIPKTHSRRSQSPRNA